jgi:uncharacterized membrane protein (UPF0127 family)
MLSKMPKENAKKIKSALKTAAFVFLLALVTFMVLRLSGHKTDPDNVAQTPVVNTESCLRLPDSSDCKFKMEVANTTDKRAIGLSYRDSMDQGKGMLFIFDRTAEQCMWMKDMKFDLDMLWLNEQKEIIKIERQVPPSSYPSSLCAQDTKYVIELNSGAANRAGLSVGQRLNF